MTLLRVGAVPLAIFLLNIGIRLALRCKNPVQQAWIGMLGGTAALAAVHFTGLLTHITVPFGPLTAGWAAVTGIPGVIGLLFAQVILQTAGL